jgi:RES domain-containing protein
MIFYRLVTGRYASEAWTGSGANQYGGRWNHQGHPAVYVSTSIALASLEILVHVKNEAILNQYQLYSIEIPNSEVESSINSGYRITGKKIRCPFPQWIWAPAGYSRAAVWR